MLSVKDNVISNREKITLSLTGEKASLFFRRHITIFHLQRHTHDLSFNHHDTTKSNSNHSKYSTSNKMMTMTMIRQGRRLQQTICQRSYSSSSPVSKLVSWTVKDENPTCWYNRITFPKNI